MKSRSPSCGRGGHPRRRAVLLATLLLAVACEGGAPPPDQAIEVSPAASRVAPGEQLQFSVTRPAGAIAADFTWTVDPPGAGVIDANGLFTASSRTITSAITCTIVATRKSDPTRVGMAVVVIDPLPLPPTLPTSMVSAAGGQQVGPGVVLESIALEPVVATDSRNSAGTVEVRSGFYPAWSSSTP
jgi:Bacterial Ig-like domain (group 2)